MKTPLYQRGNTLDAAMLWISTSYIKMMRLCCHAVPLLAVYLVEKTGNCLSLITDAREAWIKGTQTGTGVEWKRKLLVIVIKYNCD